MTGLPGGGAVSDEMPTRVMPEVDSSEPPPSGSRNPYKIAFLATIALIVAVGFVAAGFWLGGAGDDAEDAVGSTPATETESAEATQTDESQDGGEPDGDVAAGGDESDATDESGGTGESPLAPHAEDPPESEWVRALSAGGGEGEYEHVVSARSGVRFRITVTCSTKRKTEPLPGAIPVARAEAEVSLSGHPGPPPQQLMVVPAGQTQERTITWGSDNDMIVTVVVDAGPLDVHNSYTLVVEQER